MIAADSWASLTLISSAAIIFTVTYFRRKKTSSPTRRIHLLVEAFMMQGLILFVLAFFTVPSYISVPYEPVDAGSVAPQYIQRQNEQLRKIDSDLGHTRFLLIMGELVLGGMGVLFKLRSKKNETEPLTLGIN
ncbi:MAG TPA: hypothetical protein VGO50_10450 [Pyrinomonadaceae bacterium]|jgi:hypothetical protein|nr:hypothetical protein [Pyrinomonadaceae bacterium]